jgi:hypothetical protein
MASELLAAKSLAAEEPLGCDKPNLIIDSANPPATARELRELLAHSGRFFARGVPVKVVASPDGGPPTAIRLTAYRVEAHRLCRPVKEARDELVPVTLPDRVAHM